MVQNLTAITIIGVGAALLLGALVGVNFPLPGGRSSNATNFASDNAPVSPSPTPTVIRPVEETPTPTPTPTVIRPVEETPTPTSPETLAPKQDLDTSGENQPVQALW